MSYNNENAQKLEESVHTLMLKEAQPVTKGSVTYLKHTLRGYFNLNLLIKAEGLDRGAGRNDEMNAVMDEFNKFVQAGSEAEPTKDEISGFCEGIADEHVRELVAFTLLVNLAGLDGYRPSP